MRGDPSSVGEVLDRLDQLANGNESVSAGDTVEAFGSRSYGPFLLVPALLELSPLGSVPGVPTVLAAVIILFAGQMLLGRRHFWLPRLVRERRFRVARLSKATRTMRPLSERVDRWFHGRLPGLTRGPFIRVAAAVCVVLALTVPPLELVPFASSVPMGAIALFGLALLVRDGALMIAAVVLACGALAVGFGLLV
jgi:hypothetical protein